MNARGPFVMRDPNESLEQRNPGGFRPAWIEDADGRRLFTVSERGEPELARFVVNAMNAACGTEQWRGLFKVVEECGELLQVLGKLGPFPSGEHPDGKGHLKPRIEDEIADLAAATSYFGETNGLDLERARGRARRKHEQFREWGLTGVPAKAGVK